MFVLWQKIGNCMAIEWQNAIASQGFLFSSLMCQPLRSPIPVRSWNNYLLIALCFVMKGLVIYLFVELLQRCQVVQVESLKVSPGLYLHVNVLLAVSCVFSEVLMWLFFHTSWFHVSKVALSQPYKNALHDCVMPNYLTRKRSLSSWLQTVNYEWSQGAIQEDYFLDGIWECRRQVVSNKSWSV